MAGSSHLNITVHGQGPDLARLPGVEIALAMMHTSTNDLPLPEPSFKFPLAAGPLPGRASGVSDLGL
jgi:hypothetical protein